MIRRQVVRLSIVVAVAGSMLSPAWMASAQDGTPEAATPAATDPADVLAFEIYPKGKLLGDYFAPEVAAGDRASQVVVLANTGTVEFSGRTYATNVSSGVNGGFNISDVGDEPNEVTGWLDYPEEVYSIAPGTGLERTFEISVPEGTAPGQYITSLVLENAEARSVDGTENFKQVVRFAVPVFITVPGPVEPGFEIDDGRFEPGETATQLIVGISNTGNVRVRPEGTVRIADETGAEVYAIDVTMQSVYAHDATTMAITFPEPPPAGVYTVTVDLTDPETGVTAKRELAVESTGGATPVALEPIRLEGASGLPQPDAANVQFLDVSVSIVNDSDAAVTASLILDVSLDGDAVESFPLASSLALQFGTSAFQARYVPVTGWTSGTWSFSLRLQEFDPAGGAGRVLASAKLPDVVVE